MDSKTCIKCKQEKHIECFHKTIRSADGYNYYCKTCKGIMDAEFRLKNKESTKAKRHNKYKSDPELREKNRKRNSEWRKKKPELSRWHQIKRHAEDRHPPFELTFEYWVEHFWNKECYYCGNSSNGGIDRVDNNIGYTISNCVSCCFYCNTIKRDKSIEELREHLEKMLKVISR